MNRSTAPNFASPAVILRPSAEIEIPEDAPVIFGGRPQLPAEMDWPRGPKNDPMTFFAQVDLDALPPDLAVEGEVHRFPAMPSGTLFVFLALFEDGVSDALSESGSPGQAACVLNHAGSVDGLPFRDPPADAGSLLGENSHLVRDTQTSVCGRILRRQGGELRPYLSARSENALYRNMSRAAGADDLAARDKASALQEKTLRQALAGPRVDVPELLYYFPWLPDLYVDIDDNHLYFQAPLFSFAGLKQRFGPTSHVLQRKLGLLKPTFPSHLAPVPDGFPWRWSLVTNIAQRIINHQTKRFDATFSLSRGGFPLAVHIFREARIEAAEWIERAQANTGGMSEEDKKDFRNWLKRVSTTHHRLKAVRRPDPTVVAYCAHQTKVAKERGYLNIVQPEKFVGWDAPVSEADKAIAEIIDLITLVDSNNEVTPPYFGHWQAQECISYLHEILYTETAYFPYSLWREPQADDVPAFFYDICRASTLRQTSVFPIDNQQGDDDEDEDRTCNLSTGNRAPLQMFGAGHLLQSAADDYADDVLLMQIPGGFGTPVQIGEGGIIQIWIKHDDLAAGRFDRIITTSECH